LWRSEGAKRGATASRGTEWVAVLRDTTSDYIRIVGAHDLGALRYKMNEAERDEPEERDATDSR
jgi:hypothetical protein